MSMSGLDKLLLQCRLKYAGGSGGVFSRLPVAPKSRSIKGITDWGGEYP